MLRVLTTIALLLGFSAPLLAQVCPPHMPPPVAPDSRYSLAEPVSGQFVVTDLETELMWKQCPEGLSGVGCASGSVGALTWSAGLSAASASSHAGYSDWRLPSAIELHSLVETSCRDPAANTRLFPRNGVGTYWTSSTYSPLASLAWVVVFSGGYLSPSPKDSVRQVRLVRGGQWLDPFHAAGDFTPDAYMFTPQADVPPSDLRVSNAISVSGIDTPVGIGVSGDASSEYSVNGGAFTSAPGAVVDGDSVVVRHVSAATSLAAVTSTLQIGTLTADFVSTTGVPTYTVGGNLIGLASGASMVLQNNGGDDLTLNANGSFTFITALEDLSAYEVTVLTQPTGPSQTCTVSNGSGNLAGANVTNVTVSCVTNTFTVGGTLSGLASGASVVLQNNGGDNLMLNADGSFTFVTVLDDLSAYAVTVFAQPTGPSQTCTVSNGSGNLAGANVTNVTVSCVTNTFTVGGTLSGLASGASVVLQNNGGDNLMLNADGSFTFATVLDDLSAYAVTVLTQPTGPSQTCTVANGTGNLAGANVSNVEVSCLTVVHTVTPSASSGGSIAPDSPQLVEDGQSISLTLSPDPDYSIAGVGGTCGGELLGTQFTTDPITQNCTVEADFVLNPLLGVVLVGSGEGQVVSEPPGIVCPGKCEQRFPPGTVLTLSASVDTTQASTGVRPLGWFGAECASGGPCTFALDGDRSILAGFAGSRRLSLQVFGNGADAPGQDRVSIPLTAPARPANLGDTDFTIELWFKAKSGRNNAQVVCSNGVDAWIEGNVLLDRDIFGAESDFGDYGLSLMDGRLAFGVSRGSEGVTLCGGSIVNNGRWYHLAITRSVATGELNMWLNGVHQASATGPAGDIRYRPDRPAPELWPADPYLVIGAEKHDSGEGFPSFAGWVMDLHLSGTRRYTTAFTPPSSVQADADSLALYRFDEGDGPVIFDEAVQAGGPSHGLRHLGGEPAGPCWSDDVPTLGRIFRSGFELEGCQ